MTKHLGKISENLVAQYLVKQGFSILEQNYKKFFGEIDIIARQGSVIAFVEVKARTRRDSLMHELVDARKQHKIGMVARLFITTLADRQDNFVYRFDVALVSGSQGSQDITYIPNAYTLSEN